MAKLFTIPQRIDACRRIVAAAREVWGEDVDATKVRRAGDYVAARSLVLPTPCGAVEWTVSCSPTLLHVYCQYVDPMDPAKKRRATQLGGNAFSGKLNWWCAPSRRIGDPELWQLYIAEAAQSYRQFAARIAA